MMQKKISSPAPNLVPSKLIVAIDGPAGAGKSSISKQLADKLSYVLVDTGALYRCVALAVSKLLISYNDEAKVSHIASELVSSHAIELRRDGSSVFIFLSGENVTEQVRRSDIAIGASVVSQFHGVRSALLDLQRNLGQKRGVVLEGRDIGTVVFPDADIKFFLTASVETRAKRRYEEWLKGESLSSGIQKKKNLADIHREIILRDEKDMTRAESPLVQAKDAILIDSTNLSEKEALASMLDEIYCRFGSLA